MQSISRLGFAALACLALNAPAITISPLHSDVLVFIPAYEGSQLFDSGPGKSGDDARTCVWGNVNVFFSSSRYFALRMPNPLQPAPLEQVGPIDIYRGFIEAVTTPHDEEPTFRPYTRGSDFFVFSYDWRQEIATVAAPQFAEAMQSYARIHAQKTGIPADQTRFTLVTHSMGGLVARTWLSENPGWASRVSRFYMVGSPNRGSVKAVGTVVYGPDSLKGNRHGFSGFLKGLIPTDVDQNVTKLTGITRPTLYELLPFDNPNWTTVTASGHELRPSADDLLQPATWDRYWPTAALEKRLFLDGWLARRQKEGQKIQQTDWEYCQDPAHPQLRRLLAETAAWRERQGTLQHTADLLTAPGDGSRLRIIYGSGLKTPSGLISRGSHDSSKVEYTYEKGNDGDGTMEIPNVLDGFSPHASIVKELPGVTHGHLMIDERFLSYFLKDLAVTGRN